MTELLVELFERVCTFKLDKWHLRLDPAFNPYILASTGYQCSETDTVECTVCHNSVCFTDGEGEERDFMQVSQQLRKHDQACLFHGEVGKQLEATELYLKMDELCERVINSYKKYQKEEYTYPLVNLGKFWREVDAHQKKDLLLIIFQRYNIDPKEVRISFILTLLGWEYEPGHLFCSFCGRKVPIAEENHTTTEDRQKQQSQIDEEELFDPFSSHRYFCLWVHRLEGWDLYIQSLWDRLGESDELFKGLNPEKIKKIRVMLNKYLETFVIQTGEQFQKISKIMNDCESVAVSLEKEGQDMGDMKDRLNKRREDLKDYLETIEEGIRKPLKKMKI